MKKLEVSTDFFEWSCRHFAQPVMQLSEEKDPESTSRLEREYRFLRNSSIRTESREEQLRAGQSIFCLHRYWFSDVEIHQSKGFLLTEFHLGMMDS